MRPDFRPLLEIGVDLQAENAALRQRIAQLEAVRQACICGAFDHLAAEQPEGKR
jgi:hypothetical protein